MGAEVSIEEISVKSSVPLRKGEGGGSTGPAMFFSEASHQTSTLSKVVISIGDCMVEKRYTIGMYQA